MSRKRRTGSLPPPYTSFPVLFPPLRDVRTLKIRSSPRRPLQGKWDAGRPGRSSGFGLRKPLGVPASFMSRYQLQAGSAFTRGLEAWNVQASAENFCVIGTQALCWEGVVPGYRTASPWLSGTWKVELRVLLLSLQRVAS